MNVRQANGLDCCNIHHCGKYSKRGLPAALGASEIDVQFDELAIICCVVSASRPLTYSLRFAYSFLTPQR